MNMTWEKSSKVFLTDKAEVIMETTLEECRTMDYVRGHDELGKWEGWVFWDCDTEEVPNKPGNYTYTYDIRVAIWNGLHGDFDLVCMHPETKVQKLKVKTGVFTSSFYDRKIEPLVKDEEKIQDLEEEIKMWKKE